LDLRHPDEAVLEKMHRGLHELIVELRGAGTRIDLDDLWHSPSVRFDENSIAVVERSAKRLARSHMKMVSGAGHDSVYLARRVPTAMIFIPCKEGVSHNESEYASQSHAAIGADVLLNAVYDLASAHR
jgi:N-carbamoyl-L-amino-acid hydrolase